MIRMFEAMYLMIAFATLVVLIIKRNSRPLLNSGGYSLTL